MTSLNYKASAELYPSPRYAKSARDRYRRFNTAAEAIRYIMEDVPGAALNGSILEVDDRRYGGDAIRVLYESSAYPLPRHKAAA